MLVFRRSSPVGVFVVVVVVATAWVVGCTMMRPEGSGRWKWGLIVPGLKTQMRLGSPRMGPFEKL